MKREKLSNVRGGYPTRFPFRLPNRPPVLGLLLGCLAFTAGTSAQVDRSGVAVTNALGGPYLTSVLEVYDWAGSCATPPSGSGLGCTLYPPGFPANSYVTGFNPVIYEVNPFQDQYPLDVTLQGSATVGDATAQYLTLGSLGQSAAPYPSVDGGTQFVPAQGQQHGSSITLSNQAALTIDILTPSVLGITTNPVGGPALAGGGVLAAASIGALGYPADETVQADFNGGDGGLVTITNTAQLDVTNSSESGVAPAPAAFTPMTYTGIGAYSIGGMGAGNKTHDDDMAGDGGDGGVVTINNSGGVQLDIASNAYPMYGINALSQGGEGESWNYSVAQGGDGGTVSVDHQGQLQLNGSAAGIVGIRAVSLGADYNYATYSGGDYSASPGDGGVVSASLAGGGIDLLTGGVGILAVSAAGNAKPGDGGAGGAVSIDLDADSSISIAGDTSLGIGALAISTGALADIDPFSVNTANAVAPGIPGAVTLTSAGTVTTTGSMGIGLAALSVGGASVLTNADVNEQNTLGNVGTLTVADQVSGQAVTLTNTGSVQTSGDSAYGLLALSGGGGGGLLNQDSGGQSAYLGSRATADSPGGDGAEVDLTNGGSVTTGAASGGGDAAIGMVAQSIGGGGGSSNAPPVFVGAKDANGSGGGDGGTVNVGTTSGSTVATYGHNAQGILAQSIGGGGGNGANAWGLVAAVGGQGGNGGDGGEVNVTLTDDGSGAITTTGLFSKAVHAQSVGGGGGNGGSATSFYQLASVAIGGAGGSGGDGGAIDIQNQTLLQTSGNQAIGVLAHSVGGGGGDGGAASTYDVGIITLAIAVGGNAGNGGDGGSLSLENDGIIQTGCDTSASGCGYGPTIGPQLDGADAVGILAQSIGGGGGTGGSAAAKSLGLPADDIPTITADFAIGGSGGDGGSGQAVSVSNAGQIQSAGDVSYGVLAQSIGGGGGSGGDATAAAYAIEGEMPTIKLALSLGGSGGGGGSGGTVAVGNGPTTSCPGCDGSIQTHGQHATGILAQSIGAGGGTGGSGSSSASSPNLGGDTGTAIDVTTSVGGSGGDGGFGGSVTLTNASGSQIVTTGSTARGLHTQSIGGGGGDASGGSAAASGDTLQVNVAVGGSGGYGGDGGSVTLINAGSIATGAIQTNSAGQTVVTGGDAIGILVQSIGGGGGAGGSADPAASIGKAGQVEDWLNPPDNSYNADIGVGGSGGVSGQGGDVSISNSGIITTLGTRAHGILAHSIGAGGGTGGAATSSSNSVFLGPTTGSEGNAQAGTYTATITVGGGGGSAGDGGQIDIGNQGRIQTSGYGAHAILAQSIGGGGGYGAEGTVDNSSTIGLGAGWDGDGGAGGWGGGVNVTQSGSGMVWTAGDDAFGILAQSIGGGGGAASAGCTNSVARVDLGNSASLCLGNDDPSTIWNDSSDLTMTVGGAVGAYGDGEAVEVTLQDSSRVLTTGARAVGILAQSIGGGGGHMSAINESYAGLANDLAPSWGQNGGNGGDIAISVDSGSSVTTHGDGAWGIVGQSIGGSGGLFGDLSLELDASQLTSNGGPVAAGTQDANAGDISITVNGRVITHGDYAHGIFAQSIAAGGGLGLYGFAGQRGFGATTYNGGGEHHWGVNGAIDISVGAGGVVKATGTGSHGIVAQASANWDMNTPIPPITISVAGSVTGGRNGWGILVGGGSLAGHGGNPGNSVTIESGGIVGSRDGITGGAVASVQGQTDVIIQAGGTLTGNVDLGSQSAAGVTVPETIGGWIDNSGTFNSGPSLSYVMGLTNEAGGQLGVGGDGNIATTTVINLAETSNYVNDIVQFQTLGDWHVDIDALASQTADLLQVYGQIFIDGGTIVPLVTNLLPGSYLMGEALGGNGAPFIQSAPSMQASLLFEWEQSVSGNGLYLTPQPDFSGGYSVLKGSDGAVAGHLSNTWNAMPSASAGEQQTWAPVFGELSRITDSGDYADLLDQLSPQNIAADASDLAVSARAGLSASLSCPGFVGDGTLLTEGSCAWATVIADDVHRDGDVHNPAYDVTSAGLRIGGQYGLGNGWFLGAAGAYRETTAKTRGIASHSDGEAFDLSLALKKQWKRWLLAGALNLSKQWSDNKRWFQWHDERAELTSSSDDTIIAGRLRAAYTLPFEGWYLRPYLDLDLIHSNSASLHESGDNWYGLDIESSRKTTLALSPMLEAGARVDLPDGWIARLYLRGGMTWLDDPSWQREARFIGGPAAAGSFTTERRLPKHLATLDLGMQLYRTAGFEARLEYRLQSGDGYLAHGGGLRLAYRF